MRVAVYYRSCTQSVVASDCEVSFCNGGDVMLTTTARVARALVTLYFVRCVHEVSFFSLVDTLAHSSYLALTALKLI